MKKALTYSLMLVSLIALLMCSSPEDIIPPTSSEDTTITTEERMEVFEACKKKSAELNNLEDPGRPNKIPCDGWPHNLRSTHMVLQVKIFTPFLLMAALCFL